MEETMNRSEVLIVGAGPTGLVLGLWLTKQGVEVRIVDKTAAPGTTSRALAVQARTLELYRQLDLADAVVERPHEVPAVNLWARGARKVRLSFAEVAPAWPHTPPCGSFRRTNTNGCRSTGWRRRAFRSSDKRNLSASRTR